MSRVLAVDTSTWWGGVALAEDGAGGPRVVGEIGVAVRESHSVYLVRLIETLLAHAGWARSDLDAYAAVRGPGSFTGIRVGMGTITGLALATGKPRLGISSLEAMAEAFGPADAERVPLLDAGREEVYGARYDARSSPPREIVAPWLGPPERGLEGGAGEPLVFGSGADLHVERLRSAGLRSRPRRPPVGVCGAASRLALYRLAGGATDGDGMSPHYLRPADAELKR